MVAPSWQDPALWYQVNLANKSKVLESVRNLESLDLYIRASTPEVYGSSDIAVLPDGRLNPSTPYAVSHAAIDFHVDVWAPNMAFLMFARFANFYGPGQQLYRVILGLFYLHSRHVSLFRWRWTSRRSFIHSDDICSAFDSIVNLGGSAFSRV